MSTKKWILLGATVGFMGLSFGFEVSAGRALAKTDAPAADCCAHCSPDGCCCCCCAPSAEKKTEEKK